MTHLHSAFGALSGYNQQQQQQQQQQQMPAACSTSKQQQQQRQQQPYGGACPPTNAAPCAANPFETAAPASSYPSSVGCYLPANLLDQLRSLPGSTPIFILPAGSLTSGSSAPTACPTPCFSPTCIPYPMPFPVYQPFAAGGSSSSGEVDSCNCASSSGKGGRSRCSSGSSGSLEIAGPSWNDGHVCQENKLDGTVCSQKNCPASVQLQAMISQLLAIQGVVPSAITRILLKRVPASNVPDSVDEIMDKAMRCIRQLPKDGLLRESCNCREVTKLLGLYLTSSSTIPRIIPVLTTVQLKCNILKALIENLASARLMEDKNCGVEAGEPLDRLLLELKPEDELRQMLATFRERECDERVNASFAACASQRRVAEARLANVQRKIQQVEHEMQRRRDLPVDQCSNLRDYLYGSTTTSKHFDSPDPFAAICITSFKRLLLKPHVGSPETTYINSKETTCEKDVNDDDSIDLRDDVAW
ncbi:uncharacterized protein LOC131670609 [Phymastichus coffea]|uniref:uncharacterized protein LOC131670609 n=1 Tax=Phymastichus coffea TaxID=108790 RepID=UPI00273AE70E|nr:uncharacterized protein LOC131670609 [Phymastichus coffea]